MAEIVEVFGGPPRGVEGYCEVVVPVEAVYEELRSLSEQMGWTFERTVELVVGFGIERHMAENIKKIRRSLDNDL